jgi:hypothetical protein
MDRDTVTTTGSSCRDSCIVPLSGISIILFTVALLFWNEGHTLNRSRALSQGQTEFTVAAADRIDPANELRLVHMTGEAASDKPVRDPVFGVASARGIILQRTVEMYQWSEEKSSEGDDDNEKTTYRYSKEWSSDWNDSDDFHSPTDHRNPKMPYTSSTITAQPVRLGVFRLSRELVGQIDDFQPLDASSFAETRPAQIDGRPLQVAGNGYFQGGDPNQPQVGDMRISFTQALPTTVSVIARQRGDALVPHPTAHHSNIALLKLGVHDASAMFKTEKSENSSQMWIGRVAGFLFILFGLLLAFGPTRRTNWLSWKNDTWDNGIGCVTSLISSAVLTMVVIALAWVFYWSWVTFIGAIAALLLLCLARWRRRPGKRGR